MSEESKTAKCSTDATNKGGANAGAGSSDGSSGHGEAAAAAPPVRKFLKARRPSKAQGGSMHGLAEASAAAPVASVHGGVVPPSKPSAAAAASPPPFAFAPQHCLTTAAPAPPLGVALAPEFAAVHALNVVVFSQEDVEMFREALSTTATVGDLKLRLHDLDQLCVDLYTKSRFGQKEWVLLLSSEDRSLVSIRDLVAHPREDGALHFRAQVKAVWRTQSFIGLFADPFVVRCRSDVGVTWCFRLHIFITTAVLILV
jgi:hypothetical protein